MEIKSLLGKTFQPIRRVNIHTKQREKLKNFCVATK